MCKQTQPLDLNLRQNTLQPRNFRCFPRSSLHNCTVLSESHRTMRWSLGDDWMCRKRKLCLLDCLNLELSRVLRHTSRNTLRWTSLWLPLSTGSHHCMCKQTQPLDLNLRQNTLQPRNFRCFPRSSLHNCTVLSESHRTMRWSLGDD